jgi:hypothetical protein
LESLEYFRALKQVAYRKDGAICDFPWMEILEKDVSAGSYAYFFVAIATPQPLY